MTDGQRVSAALYAITWRALDLATVTGARYDTVRHWLNGRLAVPPAMLTWLEDLAAYHTAHPPPPPPDDRNAS